MSQTSNFPSKPSSKKKAVPPPLPTIALADSIEERLWFGDDDPQRSAEIASATMAAHMALITGLKPFPVVAQKVAALASRPETTPKDLRVLIERDPALGAQLLRVANSAFYRRGPTCSSIEDAVVRLGFGEVARLVAGFATMAMFKDEKGAGLRFRDHSVRVAAIVKVLADSFDERLAPTAYLCGLLHDIGKLMSLQVNEIPYHTYAPHILETPDVVHIQERKDSGYDHAVLGAHILKKWNLPQNVVDAVAYHHQAGRAFDIGGEVASLVALIRTADRIEYLHAAGFGPTEDELDRLVRDSAISYLDFGGAQLEALWPKMIAFADETMAGLR